MLRSAGPRGLDTVVFPYAACWRHFVELQLKSLLAQLRALLELPTESRRHHMIDALWREVRPLVTKLSPGEDKTDLAQVGRVIAQLAELDRDGQAFRYDKASDGTETLRSRTRSTSLPSTKRWWRWPTISTAWKSAWRRTSR
jgi:hypothetical protein